MKIDIIRMVVHERVPIININNKKSAKRHISLSVHNMIHGSGWKTLMYSYITTYGTYCV